MRTLRSDQENFVTISHFDAVLDPLRRTVEVIQKDIKEILRAVSETHNRKH